MLGQFPSHVANAERTRDFLSCWPDAAESSQPLDSYMERYELWAADYEAYLERCCSDEYAPHQGPTLLDMVDEKSACFAGALPDLFAGMKAENAIAARSRGPPSSSTTSGARARRHASARGRDGDRG